MKYMFPYFYFIYMETKDFKAIVIGDFHFGTKTNSKQWLDQMVEFFEKQIIPTVEEEKPDEVIFLGDLFDIRYSTNTIIGITVKDLVEKLCGVMKSEIQTNVIFLAGNHDYYTPRKEDMRYNTYNLVFGKEFEFKHLNSIFVTERPYYDRFGNLFLPWFYTEDPELYSQAIEHYKDDGISNIFCHTDLGKWDDGRVKALNGIKVISGHIHFPIIDEERNLYGIGACCPFNFNDVNGERYFYLFENGKFTKTYTNTTTPQFIRFFNDQIFSIEDELTNCFVELYIDKDKINKAKYIEKIQEIKNNNPTISIRTVTIDDMSQYENINGIDMNQDIKKYIASNIPDNLKSKYEIVNKKIEEREK